MVDERLDDGVRIAQLLSSELDGRTDGGLARLTVANPDRTVEGTVAGERAYDVYRDVPTEDSRTEPPRERAAAGSLLAQVFVHEDRVRIEFREGVNAAAAAATEASRLRVRPKAVEPPRTLVFVGDGVGVKRVVPVFEAALGDVE